jgi:hypothetical protein
MLEGGELLGGVSVEIQADLGKLIDGFQAAHKATAQFDRAVGAKASAAAARFEKSTASAGRAASKTAVSTGDLQRAADRIAKAYDPVVAAAYRYERELKEIDLLHRHGIIGADRHALYLRKAARAYREAEMAAKGYGAAGRAAVPAMGFGRTAIAGALASVSATALIGQGASLADEAKRIDAPPNRSGTSTRHNRTPSASLRKPATGSNPRSSYMAISSVRRRLWADRRPMRRARPRHSPRR